MKLPRAVKQTTPYGALKQAILCGEFAPGQPLVEKVVASWCRVSRTPVREALSRLEQDGLVERGDRGLVVRQRSPEEILDIYETRIALEASIGRAAANRRNEHDLRTLRRLVDRTEDVRGDDDGKVELNRQFHRAMWRAGHNESLLDLLERLDLHLARYPATTLSFPGRWEHAKKEHAAIVAAVDRRDSTLAYDISLAHFTAARDIRVKLWDDAEI
jgi:DNA-binding GntR family transcriptional regulator